MQIAPVAGFLSELKTPEGEVAKEAPDYNTRRAQQQGACSACAMSAVYAAESGVGSVQEVAEGLGVPSIFVAAAGALGGGAHGSNHEALGLAAAVMQVLQCLGLVPAPRTTHAHSRVLDALEADAVPPRLVGALSETRKTRADASAGPDVALPKEIPMALRAAVPLPCGDGVGAIASTTKGLWRPKAHCGELVRPGQELGSVVDLFGAVLETVLAPEEGGMLLVLRSKPRVDPGELVAAVVAH